MPGPTPTVAALLVSHDGSRWLPAVIDGLRGQRTPVTRVVTVDTGSHDESADLLEAAFGDVQRVSGRTHYPAAVALGLERLRAGGESCEWIWLLHDDANPDPGALRALLAAAEAHPEADILGPKLREWPSLRRLLELGVTISGTGRRETGLERGEYDQGQHDELRAVLAVNTAGMLVRRSVLEELGGFDEQLPIFGNDLDLGWRAAAAGHTTMIVPQAVVFHAEAAHRGIRRTPLTGRHTHYQERRAALYTLLVNSRARSLPFVVLRLAFGTLLRMVGFLLVRSVGEALDDLAALVSLYSRPGPIRAARRERRARGAGQGGADRGRQARVRGLLAPRWLPYRHGLDFLSDLAAAVTNQVADVAERRRMAAAERNPGSTAAQRRADDDDEHDYTDSGAVVRLLTNPVALLFAAFVVAALVGARHALGEVSGGGLSPAPESVADWWQLHVSAWHPLGMGTDVPAPAYVLPLALLGSVVGTTTAVSLLLFLAVPLTAWGAWRFLRVTGRLVGSQGAPRWLLLWGATAFALVPVVSGAWGAGRLGPVVATTALPWLAHATLGFADPDPDRRWRAAWRSGLLLTLVTAFAPVAFLFGLLLGLVLIAVAWFVVRSAIRDRAVWGPPATAVLVAPVLLSPFWVPALLEGAREGLLLDIGRLPTPRVDGLDLLTGRIGDLGAPWWLGVVLVVLAVLALAPRSTRIPVLVTWVVALVAAVAALGLGNVDLAIGATTQQAGVGFLVIVLQACWVTAAVLGGQGLAATSAAVGPRRILALAMVAAMAVVPLGGLAWFLTGDDDQLGADEDTGIPAYMVQNALQGPEHGILVIDGSTDEGLAYAVRRGAGGTLGEDEILALTSENRAFTATVRSLVSRPSPAVVRDLADGGIEYVVLPEPADGGVAAGLDATAGLTQASAENRRTRAWQVTRALDPAAVDGPGSVLRTVLLVVQGLGLLVVLVLCLPTLRRRDT